MRTKLKSVKTELILLSVTAVFLCGLMGLARQDRLAADIVQTEADLPPEQIEVVLVDVNTAGTEELTALPGIGESLARRIIAEREENGPFETPEDLLRVSGIGEKKLEELRDHVTVTTGNKGAEQ